MDEFHLFGEIAIRKGYVTATQVRKALEVQAETVRKGERHKLIGVLLVDLGYLTPAQVMDVLATSDAEQATRPIRVAAPPEELDPLLPAG